MQKKVILIRHGQTDWVRQRRYCGLTDLGLNENGKEQGGKLCRRLEKEVIHKVYSSDLRRAFEFAGMVFKGISIERLKAFSEINFGIFEGLTYQENMDKYPKIYDKWLKNPSETDIPKGESLKDLAERVRPAFASILPLDNNSNNNSTIVICTHGGPIRVLLCDALGLGLEDIWQVKVDCASVSIIEFTKGKAKVESVNDTSYLNG